MGDEGLQSRGDLLQRKNLKVLRPLNTNTNSRNAMRHPPDHLCLNPPSQAVLMVFGNVENVT